MSRSRLLVLTLLATLPGCLSSRAAPVHVTTVPEIQRIFVEPLGESPDAMSARAQLIERMAARERFQVVDQRDSADAILRGHIELQVIEAPWPNPIRGVGRLTLESRRSGRVLWRAEYGRWNPTEPAVESVPAMALVRTVDFFDQALHQADARSGAALVARQPNDAW